MRTNGQRTILAWMLIVAPLFGCSPKAGQSTAAANDGLSGTSGATVAGTAVQNAATLPAQSSSPSPTPSSTPTFAPTNTPTITPTPTPSLILPGLYNAHGCASKPGLDGKYTFCVDSVTVLPNHNMQFVVSWKFSSIPTGWTVTKRSDEGNRHMYVIDERGAFYHSIAGGGAAFQEAPMTAGEAVYGWFEFEAPPPGVTTFEFHDDDTHLVIGNLKLIDRIIVNADYELANYPLRLTYPLAHWEPKKQDDGSMVLEHKDLPGCTIQDRPAGEPEGKLKNTIELGGVTYEIFGYIDSQQNLGVREYLASSPFPGLDPAAKPFLLLKIPLDDSQACILAATDVLSTLAPKGEAP